MKALACLAQPTPRLARSLHLPAIAVLLGSLLLAPAVLAVEPAAAAPLATASAPAAQASGPAAASEPSPTATDNPAQPASAAAAAPAHDLSPWGMYQGADVVVKGVMIGLLLASVVTWTIWLAKGLELLGARRRLRGELADFKGLRSLDQAAELAHAKHSFSAVLIEDAQDELRLSANLVEKEGIKERVSFRLERLVAASGRQMSVGTGVLATIGSVSPFVGLFGTVWGIMNSFIGIAESQTTNLAVVAPGIAEALLATALGLVAAIPAVVIYNVFARSIAGYKAQVADISAQVLLLVSRDLDRQPPTAAPRSAAPMAKVG
ncbi:biopolymer transport protein ExbB [Geopseudomonas sagittaria]|uniref:Biopolymer transport protein ExbB n=1 Tax=Geopseudomonas sagittaria TaxID=1135990 RepID=A0A1I5UID0_9GAMM|nr:tonB-system energizer ExbB [Pseudomonas sagittaria]MCM2330465.1 tonB-system energizer ExbB [Pseudomonas sagittaria]SFP95044.1 biopolymer transport protein ExbB [Pseudomonas sagittaria]